MKNVPLTVEVANEIAGALQRLHELGDSKIINPSNEAEVTGLRRYLSNTLPQYANELLGNWFVLRNEYEPLIQGFTGLLGRSMANLKREVAPAADSPAPENVTPLEQPKE